MVSFLAIYRGRSLEKAELVAVSAEPSLVAHVAASLLKDCGDTTESDEALGALRAGKRKALDVIRSESST